jgi:probable addiction module antidote protein
MPKRTRDYHAYLVKRLVDPKAAEDYLNAAINDSDEMFLKALRNVAEARRMSKVAEQAGVSRESLYRTLSEEGNPRFNTLTSILRVLGLRITLQAEAAFSSAEDTSPSMLLTMDQIHRETPIDLGETGKLLGARGLVSSGSQWTPANASL